MLRWTHLRAIHAMESVNYILFVVSDLVRKFNGERRSVYLCVQQPILHRAWWSPSYGWLWIRRLAYISKIPIHQLSNVAPHIWAWILHCIAYSSLGCQTHHMRDLDQLLKNGVEKKCILSYVNINHKKCDALQEPLARLISSEKSHSSCSNHRCPQRPHHHVFSKQERPEFWPTNPATRITKATIGSASLLWRRSRHYASKTPVCKMLQDRTKT
jgi:hypothetical protein